MFDGPKWSKREAQAGEMEWMKQRDGARIGGTGVQETREGGELGDK